MYRDTFLVYTALQWPRLPGRAVAICAMEAATSVFPLASDGGLGGGPHGLGRGGADGRTPSTTLFGRSSTCMAVTPTRRSRCDVQ